MGKNTNPQLYQFFHFVSGGRADGHGNFFVPSGSEKAWFGKKAGDQRKMFFSLLRKCKYLCHYDAPAGDKHKDNGCACARKNSWCYHVPTAAPRTTARAFDSGGHVRLMAGAV